MTTTIDSEDAEITAADVARLLGCTAHDLTLLLAGRVSDELIVEARGWNRAGRFADTGRAFAHHLLTTAMPTTDAVPSMIGSLLEADALGDDEQLANVNALIYTLLDNSDDDANPLDSTFHFAPSVAGKATTEAIISRAASNANVLAVWSAERRPIVDSPWPPSRTVYVVEASVDADPVELTGTFHDVLSDEADDLPLVEVIAAGVLPAEYHRRIVDDGDVIWTRLARTDLQVADVFDNVVDGVGEFADDHPTLPTDELNELVAYLLAAPIIVDTGSWDHDVMTSEPSPSVPLTIRTDGTWIWSDATTHYLERHGIAPSPAFLEHLIAAPAQPPPVDIDSLRRATDVLTEQDAAPESDVPAQEAAVRI